MSPTPMSSATCFITLSAGVKPGYVVTPGRIARHKGLEDLIRAVGELDDGDWRLEISGAEDREAKVAEYKDKFANPYIAAERGYIDEIIEPRFTRRKLITTFGSLCPVCA